MHRLHSFQRPGGSKRKFLKGTVISHEYRGREQKGRLYRGKAAAWTFFIEKELRS